MGEAQWCVFVCCRGFYFSKAKHVELSDEREREKELRAKMIGKQNKAMDVKKDQTEKTQEAGHE